MSARPLKTLVAHPPAPDNVRPETDIETKTAPMTVPKTLKNPGLIAVAPRKTAASAGKRSSLPPPAVALPMRESCMTPAAAAMAPPRMNVHQTLRSTRMPTKRADAAFEPIAYIERPYGVWARKYQAMIAAARTTYTTTGRPSHLAEPKALIAGSMPAAIVWPDVYQSAIPDRSIATPRVVTNGLIFSLVIKKPFRQPTTAPSKIERTTANPSGRPDFAMSPAVST